MAVYKRDIIDINLETGNIYRSWLKHSIGYKDQKADHFGVRVFRDGEAVSLTGVSVQGVFMPPQGSPIAITSGNIVSGNVAEVVLPQACYNYDGQFTLAIKLVDSTNSVTGTVRIVDGMVDNTHASGTVAPTSAVPTYQEVLSVYEQAIVVIGKSVRFDTDQSLTDAQKTTARTNIAAASTGELSDLKSALNAEYEYLFEKDIATTPNNNFDNDISFTPVKEADYYVIVILKGASTGAVLLSTRNGSSSVDTNFMRVTAADGYGFMVYRPSGVFNKIRLYTSDNFNGSSVYVTLLQNGDITKYEEEKILNGIDEITSIQKYGAVNSISVEWETGAKAVNATTGAVVDLTGSTDKWKASKYFRVPADGKLIITMPKIIASSAVIGIAFYSLTGQFVSGVSVNGNAEVNYNCELREVDVPEGATLAKTTYYSSIYEKVPFFASVISGKGIVESIAVSDAYGKTGMYGIKEEGFYKNDGTFVSNNTWSAFKFDLQYVANIETLGLTVNAIEGKFQAYSTTIPSVMFEDENGGVLLGKYSDTTSETFLYSGIPSGAKYLICNGTASTIAMLNTRSAESEYILVAASDAPDAIKRKSSIVCNGTNDELAIQTAIDVCAKYHGGKIKLSQGTFYIGSFAKENNTSILFPTGGSSSISIKMEGAGAAFTATETGGSTLITMTNTMYDSLDNNTQYTIFGAKSSTATYLSTLSLDLSDIKIELPNNQKKIICVDLKYVNKSFLQRMQLRGWNFAYPGQSSTYKAVAVEGCIGISFPGGSSYGYQNDYRNIVCTGFYEGFRIGGEHIVAIKLSTVYCVYGYTFGNYNWGNGANHPIVMIECADERNVNLPLFVANGEQGNQNHTGCQDINLISFSIERLASETPGGVLGELAKESYPGAFRGSVEYTIQDEYSGHGNSVDIPFWKDGSGHGMVSRNVAQLQSCTSAVRLTYAPNFLQRIWDTTLNKEVICIDPANKTWVDVNGNNVDS